MRAAVIVALAACARTTPKGPVPPKECAHDGAVLHAVNQCADLRGGTSGFTIYQAVAGPHRGERIMSRYHETPSGGSALSQWVVARIDPRPRYATAVWPNQCLVPGLLQQGQPFDGDVIEATAYDTETAALRAFKYWCD